MQKARFSIYLLAISATFFPFFSPYFCDYLCLSLVKVFYFKVEFSPFVRPVCLPTFDRSYNGHTTTVVGWGKVTDSLTRLYIFL